MSSKLAIKVEDLSKRYEIYNLPTDRLKQIFLPNFNKLFNRQQRNYFQEFWALRDVSFEIKKGQTVGIIGQNGSGKSTLLQLICGTLSPTTGSVSTNGRVAALLELGSGFNPEFTGIENIYTYASILGLNKNEIESKFDDIISFADIGDFVEQPLKIYSSGMFARLAFSVAINVDPEILIVDEALSVGDMFFQQKCMLRMERMLNNGTTILFVSHSLPQVRNLCEKAIYLNGGKVLGFGQSKAICDLYLNDMSGLKAPHKSESPEKLDSSSDIISNEPVKENLFCIDSNFSRKISERSGGGELEFVSLYCYLDKKIVTEASMGDRLKIVTSFIVHEDIKAGTAIGINVTDNLGNTIIALNSNYFDVYLPDMLAGERRCISYEFDLKVMNIDLIFGVGAKPDPWGNYFYDRIFGACHLKVVAPEVLSKKNIGGILYPDDLVIKVN